MWTEPRDWVPGEIPTAQILDTHVRDNFLAVWPLASYCFMLRPYTTVETVIEDRFLQCNGVAVSRTTYADLFDICNAFTPPLPFGAGDGSTTFNIPDLRGRTPWAEGEHADVDTVGDSDGLGVASRSPVHYHLSQYGSNSVGGTVPIVGAFDAAITRTYPTTPGSSGRPQDKPAYLVAGSWFLYFRS